MLPFSAIPEGLFISFALYARPSVDLSLQAQLTKTKALIEAAFASVPYPVGQDVVSNQDGEWQVEAYTNQHWRDIPPDILRITTLRFFSAAGFHFFIPAFLLAALKEEHSDIREYVFVIFLPTDEALWFEHLSLFNLEQLLAVQQCLKTIDAVYLQIVQACEPFHPFAPLGLWFEDDFPQRLWTQVTHARPEKDL